MRDKKELLKLCLDNIERVGIKTGLCIYFDELVHQRIISHREQHELNKLIHKYKVKNRSLFSGLYDRRRVITGYSGQVGHVRKYIYFWQMGLLEPRKKYLEYLYEKLK